MSRIVECATVAAEWEQRDFSCGLWTDPAGQEWLDYVHAVDELLMLVEGEIELEMEGRTFKPPIGEEIFIPAGVSHTVRNTGDTTNHWLYGYKR